MKFIVNDRTIKADGETIISYNLDYMAEFEFDPEWSDKIITARFVLTNGNYYDVILEDNKCQIPLFKKGLVALGVYTDEFTSTYVTLSVHSSIKDLGNNEVIPPSEDVYQQIIRMIEEGKIKGDKGDPGDDYIITESDYQAIADRVPQPDLSDYVKNTDYATPTKGGVVKATAWNGLTMLNGELRGESLTSEAYKGRNNYHIISKGTLENVLNERLKEPQFELIEEITNTSDSEATVDRMAEPNGEPYNFKNILIDMEATNPNNGSANCYAYFTTVAKESNALLYWWSPQKTSTTPKHMIIGAHNNGGVLVPFGTTWSADSNSAGIYQGNILVNSIAHRGETIKRINLARVPSGAVVKIYGIRA